MITKIQLVNFRNFTSQTLSFGKTITVIIGANATGKTNILESLSLLATGKSFRARVEEEMIAYPEDLARVKGKLDDKTILEAVLTRGEIRVGNAKVEKVSRKRLFVNGVPRRMIDFGGKFRVVFFGPQDLDLVTQSPTIRRRFLDMVLSQVDREYKRALISYEKGLRQRNRLLLRIREEGISRSQLLFWNKLLIKNGDYLTQKREEFLDFANSSSEIDGQRFKLEYDKSAISEGRLDQYREEEIAAATTLVGPHRDDFVFWANDQEPARNLASYGSRGEQRMGILWLKLAELAFIEEKTHEKPTLLLDDIFSELDHKHRDVVMAVTRNQQTIITTADPHFVRDLKGIEKINLEN